MVRRRERETLALASPRPGALHDTSTEGDGWRCLPAARACGRSALFASRFVIPALLFVVVALLFGIWILRHPKVVHSVGLAEEVRRRCERHTRYGREQDNDRRALALVHAQGTEATSEDVMYALSRPHGSHS